MPDTPDCEHGWVHLCGGPHEPRDDNDTRKIVPERPLLEGGCATIRCTLHCSCFTPDDLHEPDCALAGSVG